MRFTFAISLVSLMLLLLLMPSVLGIGFDLVALPKENSVSRRCFSMYIGKDLLTTGKITVSPGQNSQINFQVSPSLNVFMSVSFV